MEFVQFLTFLGLCVANIVFAFGVRQFWKYEEKGARLMIFAVRVFILTGGTESALAIADGYVPIVWNFFTNL